MARFETKKSLLVEAKPPTMGVRTSPGEIAIVIDADQVAQIAHLTAAEAVQLGVNLIQLAAQAQAMADAQRLQVADRLPPITRTNGTAVRP